LEAADFAEGNGFEVLNHSHAVITYETDLHKLVTKIREDRLVDDFD
jgi:hypothetical protein